MAQNIMRRNDMAVPGVGGILRLTSDPSAPNAVNLNETVSLSDGAVSVTLPVADYSGYSLLTFVWRAIDGSGNEVADTWTMVPVSGTTVLGQAEGPNGENPPVFGATAGLSPSYEMCITDTSGRMGYSRGVQAISSNPVALVVTTNPTLDTPTEGEPLAGNGPVFTGEPNVTWSWVYQMAEDGSGTNAVDVAGVGMAPEIDPPRNYLRRGALFTGSGTAGLEGPYWSEWEQIQPASVETGFIGFAVAQTANPVLPEHAVGDWLIAAAVKTGDHGGVAPSVTNGTSENWQLWGSAIDGTDRAIAVYRQLATRTNHTITWANVGGNADRPVWVYRGRTPDVLRIQTFGNALTFTYPEL